MEDDVYQGWSFPHRKIRCAACLRALTVFEADGNAGVCTSCDTPICVFCGCTDENPCVHPSFPNGELNCSWTDAGECSHCTQKLIEELYYLASGQWEKVAPPEAAGRQLVGLVAG